MVNPIKQYRRMKRIVDYYEDCMLDMIRCKKYAELGLLLLSNVNVGDTVYLIGAQLTIFCRPIKCRVEKIEFIGNNDAMIYLKDFFDSGDTESRYCVRNRQFNKLFFLNFESAWKELRRRRDS